MNKDFCYRGTAGDNTRPAPFDKKNDSSAGKENEPLHVNPADKTSMKNPNLFPPKKYEQNRFKAIRFK